MIQWIHNLPAWDATFAIICIGVAVLGTALVGAVLVVSKTAQAKEWQEKYKAKENELAEKNAQLEESEHNYAVLREMYNFEVRKQIRKNAG
ncbi:MAG: hypothetical protein MJ168_05515 [Clostridia bacterium]|nr:hypothetical protein [Clostridia bacterium]